MAADPQRYQDWVSAFSAGTDFEADLVRDRLDDHGIAAVVLTQRDHAFNLNVGDMAPVHVMVRPADLEKAHALLQEQPLSDAELEEAAMDADPHAPDAHDAEREAMLDSGIDTLRFASPDDAEFADEEYDDKGDDPEDAR